MYKLRPYQQEAVDRALAHFRRSRNPALIVLPTGAGKSLVIAELAKIAKGRVLVLAHVKELVEQNYLKYTSYELEAGIYSAGLNQKQTHQKVIFGSIQSVARADESFFKDFSLVIIDECHRVSDESQSQYSTVIKSLQEHNSQICILGLTATPYRLGLGWIYQFNANGELKSEQERFFKKCLYELPLEYMIKNNYLTRPVKIDTPVTSYDFSELTEKGRMYTAAEVEEILKQQKRMTPLIVKNIIDIADKYDRKAVMIFSANVKHAKEILSHLPDGEAQIILGDTDNNERDTLIEEFKQQKFKYLVNVSVLTTGFDAPHVDVVAIMRPTESVGLYQQIIGRGLRLSPGKKECFILDYAGIGFNIYSPEVGDKKPNSESVPVYITCPDCSFENTFWGLVDDDGDVIEHYGRKCKGAVEDARTLEYKPCGFLFRYKLCPSCGQQNDISARDCKNCNSVLVDADAKLKQAKLSKNAHILRPDSIELNEKTDKNGAPFLEVKYYDYDAKYLSEIHYLNNQTGRMKFDVNFLRSHLRRPELKPHLKAPQEVISIQNHLRMPSFIIARKQGKFWRITEKIFSEEMSR